MMRAMASLLFLSLVSCTTQSAPPPTEDSGGTILPEADGAVCACASPDCLPNCSDLPACKVVCNSVGSLVWTDACGNIQYVENCANGCVDASPVRCQ